jgi:hypothetical protein
VEVAAATTKLPLVDVGVNNNGLWIEDHPVPKDQYPSIHSTASVTQDYFRAMDIPIIEGRTFREDGSDHAPHEMIIGKALAQRFWPNESPIGKRVKTGGPGTPWSTIVGVVGDVHDEALTKPVDEMVYVPMLRLFQPTPPSRDTVFADNSMTLTIRTATDPLSVVPAVRREILAMDRSLALVNIGPLSDVVSGAMARTTFAVIVIGAAAGVALLLGVIGIYGVISYMVSLRAREIGIRMALGAQSRQVRRMVVRHGLVLAFVGVGIGLACALAVSQLIGSLLYSVAPVIR